MQFYCAKVHAFARSTLLKLCAGALKKCFGLFFTRTTIYESPERKFKEKPTTKTGAHCSLFWYTNTIGRVYGRESRRIIYIREENVFLQIAFTYSDLNQSHSRRSASNSCLPTTPLVLNSVKKVLFFILKLVRRDAKLFYNAFGSVNLYKLQTQNQSASHDHKRIDAFKRISVTICEATRQQSQIYGHSDHFYTYTQKLFSTRFKRNFTFLYCFSFRQRFFTFHVIFQVRIFRKYVWQNGRFLTSCLHTFYVYLASYVWF